MKQFLFIFLMLIGLTAHGQRFVKTFDTLDQLLAANPNDVHTNAHVLGSRGGDFTYYKGDTTATNAVIDYAPTSGFSGRWRRQWDGVNASVEWAGAIPDDGIDDAPAIQATIDYLHSTKKRGNAILHGGIYDQNSTIYLKLRTNLKGQGGFKLTEVMSSSSASSVYLLGGVSQLKMMNSMETTMVEAYVPDGYERQNETLEDGTAAISRIADVGIEDIVFRGNVSTTGTTIWHGILLRNIFSADIRNCGFIFIRGNPVHCWDVNFLTMRDLWLKGGAGNQPTLGIFMYSSADNIIQNVTGGGFQGPGIWYNSVSTWYNLADNLFMYNQFASNTIWAASSVATTGIFTFPSTVPVLTGQQVELRTDGTLPTPFTDTQLYWAVRLSSTTFGIHTNYAQATNGVYLACTGGSGTHSITIGPASSIYMSGGANNNSFGVVRTDQNSGPGVYLRKAYGNIFSALMSPRNSGHENQETIPEEDKVGVLLDKDANDNIIFATISDSTYGFATRGNAARNILNGVFPINVTVERTNSNTAIANYQYIKLPSENKVSWGDATTQTALALSGNASGVRIVTLERPSLSQKVGIGVAPGGFNFWDETAGRGIGLLTYDGTTYRLSFGGAQASPKAAVIEGNNGSGTNASGGNTIIQGGLGTGTGTGGAIRWQLGVPTGSGTTQQSPGTRGGIEVEGQLSLYSFPSADPLALTVGQVWHRSDLGKFRVRYGASTENLATESYVTAAISGSGALTDGDKTDITVSGTGTVFTIDNSVVTYAKMQNVSAVSKLLGRNSTTTGPPEEITLGSGLTMTGSTLSASGGGSGDVVGPASATDNAIARFDLTTGKLIQNSAATIADTTGDITAGKYNGVTISGASTPSIAVTGTTTVSGANTGDQTITLTSDVTGSGTGSFATTIASGAVTYAKMQNVSAASKLLGRGSAAGAGSPQEITIGAGLTMSGTTLTASGATVADSDYGDITVSGSGTLWSIDLSSITYDKIQDMNHTRILGRKTASGIGAPEELTVSDILDWPSGAAPAFGDVLYRGASSWARLAPGTSGQFLQTQGAGASPQWANPSVAGSALTGSSLAAGITSSSLTSFGASPTLTTPNIGVATATSVNKVAITAPATSATLTIANGKTLTVNNSITFTGTDGTTMTLPPASASLGYLNIPQGSKSADYTLVLADSGTHIFHPSSDANSRTFTIPANGSVAFPVGTAVTFYNASANSCTIAITTDTLRKAGTGTTGSVTLPQYALATIMKVTTTEWVISGNGI